MSEVAKTISFIAVAIVSLIAAWATQPSSAELDFAELIGEDLTKHFTDTGEAKRLRIVDFDEDSATLREFEVAEEGGLWTIPSKNGYPADAERQMAEAATSLKDRTILAVASESAGDHEQYGVIDPLSPKLEVGQKGVGRHVTISNTNNESLVDLIIGREVKDATNDQHYVREEGRDVVYVIELDPEPLSTHFEDWIEKDLLKLNSWGIQEVEIKDYSAEFVPVMTNQGRFAIQVAWVPRSEMTLGYDDSDAKWTPQLLKEFNAGTEGYDEFELADDEELNTEQLNELKSALDDLKIVDVARKPVGLSADLKAGGDFLDNAEARQDLRTRGFAAIPARSGEEGQEIISSEGEVVCTMKNGVEYVLRFGGLRMTSGSGDTQTDDADEEEGGPTSTDEGVQRYLFVMARFNEDAVERPALEDLPDLPEDTVEVAADVADGEPDEENEEEQEGEDTAVDPPSDDSATTPDGLAATRSGASTTDDDSTSDEAERTTEADSADLAQDEAADATDEQSNELAQLIAQRQRIETENQRKLDEHADKLEQGRQTVKDLNLRFGDWYFVVSNDVFQNVRLSRDDVIKKKDAGESADGDTSAVGAPGTGIPGLPSFPGVGQ